MLNVTSITNDECEDRVYRPVRYSVLCTLDGAGKGICDGDSGGPLINFKNQLVGVVNWSKPCAVGHPDGYARLSYYYGWIEKKIARARRRNF